MEIQKAHIIFSRLFLCPQVIESGGMLSIFCEKPPRLGMGDDYAEVKYVFDKQGYFLRDIGALKYYGSSYCHPFVMQHFSRETDFYEREVISACYGAQANFCLLMTREDCYVSIRPIVHILQNKMVNVLLSCYISAEKSGVDIKDVFRVLQASFAKGVPLGGLYCEKPAYADIASLKELTRRICRNVEASLPEYDFTRAFSQKHSYIEVFAGNADTAVFEADCAALFGTSEYSAIPQGHFHLGGKGAGRYDLYMLTPEHSLHVCDKANGGALAPKKRRQKSWELYRAVEYACMYRLAASYIEKKAGNVRDALHKEKSRAFAPGRLAPSAYQHNFEQFALRQIYSFEELNGFERMMLYLYYGGKTRYTQLAEKSIAAYEAMAKSVESRESLWPAIIKQARGLLPF